MSVEFCGRFLKQNDGYLFDWSGSQIKTAFKGSFLGVNLKLLEGGEVTDYFNVFIDDKLSFIFKATAEKNYYILASNLENKEHTAAIQKRTEGNFGAICCFGGFDFKDGIEITLPENQKKIIEFIGDSITAGYGNASSIRAIGFKLEEEDFSLGYPFLTAESLNCNTTVIACSGFGMFQDLNGNRENVLSNGVYNRALAHFANEEFLPESSPEIIVVNLGTNDFASNVPPNSFKMRYTQFLTKLRGKYPKTKIVAIIGTIETGYKAVDYIKSAVEERASTGDSNVFFFEIRLSSPQSDENWGADGHPSAKAHREMAEKLSEYLKTIL